MRKTSEYEKSVKRLEEIVKQLEDGQLSLEDSIQLYEEGTKLSAACYTKLKNAEQKIIELSRAEAEESGKDNNE